MAGITSVFVVWWQQMAFALSNLRVGGSNWWTLVTSFAILQIVVLRLLKAAG